MSSQEVCICCESSSWVPSVSIPTFLFGTKARILRCQNCGMGMTVPQPEITISHYQDNEKYDDLFEQKAPLYRGFARQLLSHLVGIVEPQGKSLLDIACGGGFVVEEAGEMGFSASGLEANANVVHACQQRGLTVTQGDIQSLPSHHEKYDVIVLSAILEHLPDPALLLRHCRERLNDEGVILVSQAAYDGLLPRVFPWGWYGWQPHEHFWHFTPCSLSALVGRSGFNVLSYCRGSLHHPWFLRGSIKELLGRNMAAIMARLGNFLRRGDSFNMILTKK